MLLLYDTRLMVSSHLRTFKLDLSLIYFLVYDGYSPCPLSSTSSSHGGFSYVLRDFPSACTILYFRKSSSFVPLHFASYFFTVLLSLILSRCSNYSNMFFLILTETFSMIPTILYISSLLIQSAQLTPLVPRKS